jgi:hypothetical protein
LAGSNWKVKAMNQPSKRQQWYGFGLIIAANIALLLVRHSGMPHDVRFLMAVGVCVIGLLGGAIWTLAAYWRGTARV